MTESTLVKSCMPAQNVTRHSKKAHVKQHQVIHSGEKPHTCSMSDKAFSQKENKKTLIDPHWSNLLMTYHTQNKQLASHLCVLSHVSSNGPVV